MGKPTGFMEFERLNEAYDPVEQRLKHYKEFVHALNDEDAKTQGARCMDCGIPFCNNGCRSTTSFRTGMIWFIAATGSRRWMCCTPPTTSRTSPAASVRPLRGCLYAGHQRCAGGYQVDRAFHHRQGLGIWLGGATATKVQNRQKGSDYWLRPGWSGCCPAMARVGHDVTVFEKSDRIGGLLGYGIPDFKMEKTVIDRRVAQMEAEGLPSRPRFWLATRICRPASTTMPRMLSLPIL
jgi:glutamate synthase (NADPH/NADH) small chain